MTNIILIGAAISQNFGGPSVLLSTREVLNRYFPEANYSFISSISDADGFEKDKEIGLKYNIDVYSRPNPFQTFILLLYSILIRIYPTFSPSPSSNSGKLFQIFKEADILIDIWGIVYADELEYGFFKSAYNGIHFIIGKLLKKPLIKYTADIGPFNHFWNRFFGKLYLNMADLIVCRSDETKNQVEQLGIVPKLFVCPDTAFLLPTSKSIEFQTLLSEKKNYSVIIGIAVSRTIEKKETQKGIYTDIIARCAEHLINSYDALIILIPNEIYSRQKDDIFTAKKVHSIIKKKENVLLISKEYFAPELKGIIESCDFMIAARYHSIVASLSLGIPTLAISWHHKYPELMNLFDQSKYICSIYELTYEEAISLFSDLWENQCEIRSIIMQKGQTITKSVWKGGEKVKSVYDHHF